jgi:4-amino-4-deoxy-L-arabinose transferase-like glycosyltransferase
MPLLRQVLSRSLNMVTKRVLELPVRESSSGFRLYRAAAARAVDSNATDFSIQQDLLVGILAAGGRVVEEPIHYAPRVAGASKANAWKLLPAYIRLLLRLKQKRGGWRAEAGLFAALAVAALTGLCGITGGLPGPERLRALPEALRGSPDFARRLTDSWNRLYQGIALAHERRSADEPRTSVAGVVEIAPGWKFPPESLVPAARALLTQSVNPDEKKTFIVLARMRPWKLDFEPLYAQYGGAFVYPFGAVLAAAAAVRLVHLTPDLSFYLNDPSQMARLYIWGRLYILLFHGLGVWMVYELARVLSGRRAAAAAAVLFALCPAVLVQSHILKPHAAAAFWFLAAVYALVRAVEEGRPLDFLLCGLGAGMAAGAALTTAYGLALPALAWALRRDRTWRAAAAGTAAGLLVLAATNPYLILHPGDFAWEFLVYMPARAAASWTFLTDGLRGAMDGAGPSWVFAAFVSAAWAIRRGGPRRALGALFLGGFVLVWFRFSGWAASPASLRFAYPLIGVGCALAADAAFSLPFEFLGAVFLAIVLVETAARGGAVLANLSAEAGPAATRTAAADWIESHVPAGAEVGLVRYPEPAHTPPFRWDRYRLVVFENAAALGARAPQWLIADESGVAGLGAWASERYETAASFPARTFLGLAPHDDALFANAGMLVLRRRAAR